MEGTWRHTKKLLKAIYTGYYTGYIGGPLDYLDKWEDAIIRYENIAPEEATSSDAKRTTFGAQFTVINDTDFLIEQVRDTTNTWDEMASSLRKKLARRTDLNTRTASRNARINNSYSMKHSPDDQNDKHAMDMKAIQTYIYTVQKFNRKED